MHISCGLALENLEVSNFQIIFFKYKCTFELFMSQKHNNIRTKPNIIVTYLKLPVSFLLWKVISIPNVTILNKFYFSTHFCVEESVSVNSATITHRLLIWVRGSIYSLCTINLTGGVCIVSFEKSKLKLWISNGGRYIISINLRVYRTWIKASWILKPNLDDNND